MLAGAGHRGGELGIGVEPAGAFGRRHCPVDDLFATEEREVEGQPATQRSPVA